MKNILIIGGSSGIGASLIEKLTNNPDYNVVATFNHGKISSAENVKSFRFDVLSDTLDLSLLSDVIDGVVYCPGSINLLPFHRIKPEAFQDDFNCLSKT